MLGDDLGQGVLEQRHAVERGRAAVVRDADFLRQLAVLDVELVQGLDVVARERDAHHQHVLALLMAEFLDDVLGRWPQPRHRTDLGLVRDQVLVAVRQAPHHLVHGGADLGRVGVAAVDDAHRQGVGAEDDDHVVALVLREAGQSLFDRLRHRLDEARVRRPAVDDAPVERVLQPQAPRRAPQLVERGPGGGARELRVLGERDRAAHAVGLHRLQGVLATRVDVAERHVELVRRGAWRQAVEALDHATPLLFGPAKDR